jgi:hypothetical protein
LVYQLPQKIAFIEIAQHPLKKTGAVIYASSTKQV